MKNALLLFIVAILTFAIFLPSYQTLQGKKAKNDEYQKQIEDLVQKNTELREEKRRLENDPVYLEGVAREKMGVAKEGEVVYKLNPVAPEEE